MEWRDCIVLCGAELEPFRCRRFVVRGDTIAAIDRLEPCPVIERGALVIIPGLYNGHTHMGDSCLPDGATGMTLEEAFFRPAGYKYRELAKQTPESQLAHLTAHLRYMARTGTVCHLDFREQGVAGAELLRAASEASGVESVILSQFDGAPFDPAVLEADAEDLPPPARAELEAMLAVADGFSESTMNDQTSTAWRSIREITTRAGKLRAIHCLENAGYRDLSLARTGKGDLTRALELYDPQLIVHLTVANAEEIALMAGSGKTGVLNPRANANLGLPLPPVAALLEAGVNLLLGTDNGMLNSPNLLAELDFTYKLAKSQYADAIQPDPRRILRMATSNICPALGGDHHGRLEVGLPASFVVLDFHQPHLRASRHIPASVLTRVTPEDVLCTVRQGRVLYRSETL